MTALGFSLGDEENVLKLNFGDDLIIDVLEILEHLKLINFMVSKL